MENVILIRYSEIHLKGKNRPFFEKVLKNNIKNNVKKFNAQVRLAGSRYIVSGYDIKDEEEIKENVKSVFGVHSFSVAKEIDTDLNAIEEFFKAYELETKTFKVNTKRADKKFSMKSPMLSAHIGGIVLSGNVGSKVDLHNPQTVINIDIREHGKTYIFDKNVMAYSGMPVGTSGKGLALLSGGLDSPVAIWRMASRGMQIDCIHYHSFPYTSEQAKDKVLDLAKLLTKFTGKMRVYVVPFTSIQEHIHKHCREEYMITIMRRYMVRIAEQVAKENGHQALITGESLAQVASQTVESLTSTQSAVKDLPVFRPLIGNNKEDIVKIAKEINTYETSILPYEDCCTVFLPKKPLIKPVIAKVEAEENNLPEESLIEEAIKNTEIINL